MLHKQLTPAARRLTIFSFGQGSEIRMASYSDGLDTVIGSVKKLKIYKLKY